MQKIWLFLLAIFVTLFYTGYFFDKTSIPKQSDLIISLGGPGHARLSKALSLLEKNYSNTHTMIQTGNHVRIFINQDGNITISQLPQIETKNTLAEIQFLKSYMLTHHLTSVLVVSDPPHSRRILFFANTVYDFPKSGLNLSVISSDPAWWNSMTYYTNLHAIKFIGMESIKYLYYQLAYHLNFLEDKSLSVLAIPVKY